MPENFAIFISHKGEDSNIADRIRVAIEGLCGETAKCFLSERIAHGQDWLNELHSQLQFSKYLLLIYTDPKEDWSWCMYESGYFSALSKIRVGHDDDLIDGRRIFCLHHEDLPPPSPLAHLQATKATHDRVRQFTRTILNDNKLRVSPDREERAISEIISCFVSRDAIRFTSHRLTLVVKEKGKINPSESLEKAIPEGSYFYGSEESLRAIFQRSDDRHQLSWKLAVDTSRRIAKISESQEQFDTKWLTELMDVVYNASQHYAPQRPIRGLVFTGANEIIYVPVVHEISEHRTGMLSCEIVFIKAEGNQYPKAPEHIRHLMIATRVAIRFRQEFLEEFKDFGKMARAAARLGKADVFRGKVWRQFYEVLTEGTIRGLTVDALNRAFSEMGRDRLREMSEEFQECAIKLAEIVGGKADFSTSIIQAKETGFNDDEIETLNEIYMKLDEHNFTFLAMANVALDAYFKSLIPSEKWDKVRMAVAGVAPRVGD